MTENKQPAPVQITLFGNQPADIVASWAKEQTLEKIKKGNEQRNELLKLLAKAAGKTDDDITGAINKLADKVDDSNEDRKTGSVQIVQGQEKNYKAIWEYQRKLSNITGTLSSIANTADAKSMFGQVSGGLGSLGSVLGKINPELTYVFGTFKGIVDVASNFYHRLIDLNKSTQELYATGLVFNGGMRGIVAAASDAGISVTDFAKILTKYGAVGVSVGVNRLAKLNNLFLQQTNLGANLMMTQEEASDAFLETMEMLRTSGRLVGMSDQQIVKSGENMLKSFNELAEQTGKNREELRKATADLIKRPDVDIVMRSLSAEAKEKLGGVLQQLGGFDKDAGGMLADTIAKIQLAGGSLYNLDENTRKFITLIPEAGDLIQQAAMGNAEALAQLPKVMNTEGVAKKMADFYTAFPESMKMAQMLSAGTRAQADAQERFAKMSASQRAEQEAALKEQQKQQAIQNDVNKAFKRFSGSFDKLALGFANTLLPVVDLVSTGFEKLGNVISGIAGVADMGGGLGGTVMSVTAVLSSGLFLTASLKFLRKLVGSSIKSLLGPLMKPGGLPDLPKGAGPAEFARHGAGGGGLLSSIGKGLGGIGQGLKGLGEGTGKAIYAIMRGAALGLRAMSDLKLLKGVVVLGGLAGVAWIAGKAFKTFEKVSWSSLGKAAVAITGLGVAAALAGASGGEIAFGGIVLGAAIAAIGGGLWVAAKGLKLLQEISWQTLGKAGVALVGLGLASAAAGLVAPLIGVGAVAIGSAIGIIGTAIAGAAWITGKALPTLAEGLGAFSSIDGEELEKTGDGMIALGKGLAMLGGGGVVNAVGSIATKILSYFADDPKQQIDRFVDIFGSLAKAKDTIDDGVSVLEKINKIDVTSNISSIIENIAIAFSSNWFSKDLGDVKEDLLVKFFHLFDVIKEKGGGVAAAADILNQIARINVSRSIGETIQTLSNSFTTNWFSKDLGDVDETLIKKFFHIFDVLGKASSGVSAGAYVLDTISKLDVSKKIPDNLAALADVFSTHWFSKDITDIDTDVIEKFFVNFAILGASKNSVESGAKVLKLIADMDIGNNIQNNIQMLAKLFSDSAWYKSANAADIKEDVLEKFFKIFDLLKENRARIEAGAPTLRLFHDIGVTSADSEGIAAIANMFSYHSTVKDLSNVNLDYIDVLGEIFSRIGKRTNDIINGAGAMAALGTIDLSDSKIKGIASLTNLFTSGYIEGLNKVELNLVDVLGNIFQKFSDRKSSFESGADVLYQLGGLEFTDEKMKGLALFGGMFSKGTSALGKAWAAVTGGDSTANINAIDTLAVIFGKFGENTVSFINGAGALAALNTINVDGDKLTNLFSLISDKMFPEDFDPTSVLGRIDGMMKIFDKFAKNQAIIVQAVDSINTIGNIDTTSLQVLQNLFSTIPGSSNTSAANVGLPTANITNIDKTTSDYYEKTTMQFNRMIELLELAHADAIDLKRIETDGLKDITDAVKSTSGRIF